MSSSLKPLVQFFTRFHMGLSVEVVLSVCSNGLAQLKKMAVMPIYGEKLENFLLKNQESCKIESLYVASSTQDLPTLFK